MKNLQTASLFALSLALATSCAKKHNDAPAPQPVVAVQPQLAAEYATACHSDMPNSSQIDRIQTNASILRMSTELYDGTDCSPTNLKSIQFTSDGFQSKVGEQYDLTTDWPHFDVSDYTRTIDFDAKYMRVDYNQKQGSYPSNGYPPVPEVHVTNILSGNFAWDMKGDTPVPFTRL
ncbi:MAG: hypothetical protein ACXWP1_04205, partial [Bdellovibrionota bacterium]